VSGTIKFIISVINKLHDLLVTVTKSDFLAFLTDFNDFWVYVGVQGAQEFIFAFSFSKKVNSKSSMMLYCTSSTEFKKSIIEKKHIQSIDDIKHRQRRVKTR